MLWQVLLPVEPNKKNLKTAVSYAQNQIKMGWTDFISKLRALVSFKNAAQQPEEDLLQLTVHEHQHGGLLRSGSAILYYEVRGAVVTFEFQVKGKMERREGEVFWFIPRKKRSSGKLGRLNITEKTMIADSEKLAEFCITRLNSNQ